MSELFEAIKAGDAARALALAGADPSLLHNPENGVTPILYAIYHGKSELARQLAERAGEISFGEACAIGDADRVKSMLAADPSLLNSRTADGYPVAALPIFFRHPEVARWLIEQGPDVNAVAENAQRVSFVHAAAAACDRETMRMLLERGADPNAKQQLDYTPLHTAASRGDVEMAKLLLAHGADANARGSDGLSPADVARTHEQPAFAEWIASYVGE